jgi:hypothetical protein
MHKKELTVRHCRLLPWLAGGTLPVGYRPAAPSYQSCHSADLPLSVRDGGDESEL